MNPILITGALGNVGGELIRQMQNLGLSVRAADVNTVALESRFGAGPETVLFDFAKPETFTPALNSVERAFLMRPPHISDVSRYIFPFIDQARSNGIKQVVFLSLIGIEQNQRVPHYKVEQYLRSSGMAYTFLRASFFMQNLSGIHREEIRDRSEIYVPVGHGKMSFIAVRDIAAVAGKALTEPGHENQVYELTGPEALDYYQVADILSDALGKVITYRDPSVPAFIWNSMQKGKPLGLTLIMSYLYTRTKHGMSKTVTNTVREILGRDPISFEKFVAESREVWS